MSDYKISEYTWVPFEGNCDSCLNPCENEEGIYCTPNCVDCGLSEREFGFPCTHCSAIFDPEVAGRIYFQPKGGTP